MIIENVDQRSKDYSKIKDQFRPAHADYTYRHKYGLRDYRGGGRSSARETAVRVAAGAIAKKYLSETLGIRVQGYLAALGEQLLDVVTLARWMTILFSAQIPLLFEQSSIWMHSESPGIPSVRVSIFRPPVYLRTR